MSFLNLAVATIFIAWVKWGCISYSLQCQTLAIQSLVIFCMFLMALIRIESVFSVAAPLACWPRAALEGSSAALRALHVGKRKAAALPPVAPRRPGLENMESMMARRRGPGSAAVWPQYGRSLTDTLKPKAAGCRRTSTPPGALQR